MRRSANADNVEGLAFGLESQTGHPSTIVVSAPPVARAVWTGEDAGGWRMLNGLGRPTWFPDNASNNLHERNFTIVRASLGAEGAAGDLPRGAEPSFAREVAVC